METRSYFGGRATIKSLLVTDQAADRPEICARINSPRGELAVLTDGSVPIRHLSYLEMRPGMVRGNHYHKLRKEYCYVISGELTLALADVATGESVSVQIHAGEIAYIQPGIAHAFNPLGQGQAVEYAAQPFDLSDVFPHRLI
jgi:dTDP-4-dehydrorhamnose 3,5-epimerase-like enzyme